VEVDLVDQAALEERVPIEGEKISSSQDLALLAEREGAPPLSSMREVGSAGSHCVNLCWTEARQRARKTYARPAASSSGSGQSRQHAVRSDDRRDRGRHANPRVGRGAVTSHHKRWRAGAVRRRRSGPEEYANQVWVTAAPPKRDHVIGCTSCVRHSEGAGQADGFGSTPRSIHQ
jgi:hypothetical protein